MSVGLVGNANTDQAQNDCFMECVDMDVGDVTIVDVVSTPTIEAEVSVYSVEWIAPLADLTFTITADASQHYRQPINGTLNQKLADVHLKSRGYGSMNRLSFKGEALTDVHVDVLEIRGLINSFNKFEICTVSLTA